ncbi:isoleucine--tRNA ligase [Sesbania bispinosa]|nr:isoleucine--tRNA ligase [Sesbania bispinosa]
MGLAWGLNVPLFGDYKGNDEIITKEMTRREMNTGGDLGSKVWWYSDNSQPVT